VWASDHLQWHMGPSTSALPGFKHLVTLLITSDVSESFLSSQSHKPLESESSKIFSSRVRVMT